MKYLLALIILMYALPCSGQLVNGNELKKKPYYDSAVNGMILRNPASVEKIIGTRDNIIDSKDERTEVVSMKGDQLLTMIFHPGDVVNQFSQFKIEYNSNKIKSNYTIKDPEFVTGRGIKLGINEQQLVAILGKPTNKRNEKDYVEYIYKQTNGLYFGHYWLKNRKLEKFWFGEEYP